MECLDFCILATLFKNLETKFLPLSERGKPGNPCLLMPHVLNTLAKISTALFDMGMVSAHFVKWQMNIRRYLFVF